VSKYHPAQTHLILANSAEAVRLETKLGIGELGPVGLTFDLAKLYYKSNSQRKATSAMFPTFVA
jgi:hypothetical protein